MSHEAPSPVRPLSAQAGVAVILLSEQKTNSGIDLRRPYAVNYICRRVRVTLTDDRIGEKLELRKSSRCSRPRTNDGLYPLLVRQPA
jgi:hypothetical protein